MLLAPKFINYERPEGYEPDSVQVLVRQGVIERFGEVAVDYDGLSEYFEGFKMPAEKSTVVSYHSAKFGEGVLPTGLQHTPHLPFSNTFHVNAWQRFYYPNDVHGNRRPGPAKVMSLLTDRMFHSIGVDTQESDYYAVLNQHSKDITFPEFEV